MRWNHRQSILLLTAANIVRIDISGNKLSSVWKQPRSSSDGLASAIVAAASLAPHGLGETWILANDFWSSHVTLAQDVVQSIPRESLEQAIAFELEYDSGLDPFSTRVSFIPASRAEDTCHPRDQGTEVKQWWVLQIENAVIEEASKIVVGRRGKLAGLSMPGGLAAGCIGDSASPRAGEMLDQASDERLAAWAIDWLAAVRGDAGTFPVLRLERSSPTALQGRQLVAIIAACAIALCSGHFLFVRAEGKRVLGDIANLQASESPLREDIKKLELEVAHSTTLQNQAKEQLANTRQRLVLVQQQHVLWDNGRQFPTSLMQALRATAGPAHCILHLAYSRHKSIDIQGIALKNEDVLALAVKLEQLLPADQWNIQPPKLSLPAVGGPVHFTISVRYIGAGNNASVLSQLPAAASLSNSATLAASAPLVESTGSHHAR